MMGGSYLFWLGASAEEADPALVASDQATSRLAPTGFDPLREARLLGKRQREVILALSEEWGKAPDHQCAKRLWYRYHRLVDHKHCTDNCWCLTDRGLAVQRALKALA